MACSIVQGFLPSRHGLPFPNDFPRGVPVLNLPTPFGSIPIGNANGGLCGGMVFTAIDLFKFRLSPPEYPYPPVFRYLCHRLIDSFNLPFGVLKYYDWQCRPMHCQTLCGVTIREGLIRLTIDQEWNRIRSLLDADSLAPLGLVKAHSYDPFELGKNHQVLGYGYELDETSGNLSIQTYDPNYPNDDELTLTMNLSDRTSGQPIVHSREGPVIRGVFLTEYRVPDSPPDFTEP